MDNSALRESLFADAHRFLRCDAANLELLAVCRNWLRSLGFDLQRLDSLPIGVFPSPLVMKEGLLRAGFHIDEIAASGLVGDPRVAERLIGPIRNPSGRILSFWARHPEGRRPKYLFLGRDWKQETPAFGLDAALPRLHDTAGELLLVEDLLDALLLQSAGLPQVAGTLRFSSNLTPPRWQQLAALGVRRVTLVPSDDSARARPRRLGTCRRFRRPRPRGLRPIARKLRPRPRSGRVDSRHEPRDILVLAARQPRPPHR